MSLKKILASDGLISRSLKACTWVTAGTFSLQAIRLSRLLVMTWILGDPEAFAPFAICWSVLVILKAMSDAGIQHALIQNPRGNQQKYLDTAWLFDLGRNTLLIVIILLATPIISNNIFGNPDIAILLRLCCLILFFEGLTSAGLVALRKKLAFKSIMMVQVTSQIVGLAAAIIFGILLQSATAIIISEIFAAFSLCLLSYKVHPFRPTFKWDMPAARELISFGIIVYFITVINAICYKADQLLLGKLAEEKELGQYCVSMSLMWVVSIMFAQITTTVGYPALSEIQYDKKKLRQAISNIINIAQMASIPIFAIIALFSEKLVVILPEKFSQTADILRYLCPFGLAMVISGQLNPAFYAVKKVKYGLLQSIIQLLTISIFIIPVYNSPAGLKGVCLLVGISVILSDIFLWIMTLRIFGWSISSWFRDTSTMWFGLIAGILTAGICYIISHSIYSDSISFYWHNRISAILGLTVFEFICLHHYRHKFITYTQRI